jgi:peptidyl-prolyl cis-trans isomerase C
MSAGLHPDSPLPPALPLPLGGRRKGADGFVLKIFDSDLDRVMTFKKVSVLCCLGGTLAALFCGCTGEKGSAGKPKPESKIMAKVNGTPITEEELTFRLSGGPHGGSKASGIQQKALDEVITEELLYQQGLKIGLDKDLGYQAQIARLERQLAHAKRAEMTRRVYNTQVAAKTEITNSDAKSYYDKNADRIATDLHLGVILFNNKERAEEALEKIRSGATFEPIARGVMGSQVSAGREPWDLGFLSWDQIPIDFVDAVYRLKPGEVSSIVSSKRTGYQVFKLFGARKNPKADFASMSGFIMNRLRDEKVREAYEQYVEKLKKEAKIEKF